MNFWIWFAIWAVLIVGSLVWLGLIGYDLYIKLEANLHQAEKLQAKVQPIQELMQNRQPIERPTEALLDPVAAVQKQNQLARARKHKSEDRQRRLIARLHDLKVDGSRFTK